MLRSREPFASRLSVERSSVGANADNTHAWAREHSSGARVKRVIVNSCPLRCVLVGVDGEQLHLLL